MAIPDELLRMLGSLGNLGGGGDPLSALSLLSMLGGKNGLGDLSGIFQMMNGFAAPNDTGEEEPPIEVSADTPAQYSSCDHCPLQCDRAGLGLPPYEEVRQMADHWQRW